MEIFIEDIGEVVLKKSNRAKQMSIRMKPFTRITVTVPRNVSYDKAQRFVFEKQDWIKKHLISIEKQEKRLTIFTQHTTFRTLKNSLLIEDWEEYKIATRVSNGIIRIRYPKALDVKSKVVQNAIRKGIERALGKEALEYLPARTSYLAKKLGFKYKGITINCLKTRWGACSNDNHISLNLHLMRLPYHLIDYVIIHELCHTIEKNHSLKFWKLMDKVLPNTKLLDKELKNYNTKIY